MIQTLRCTCVGSGPKSDGLLFYSSDFKSLIESGDYTLDSIPPSGLICGIDYGGGVHFDLHCDGHNIHRPLAYQINDTVNCLQTSQFGIIKDISLQGNSNKYSVNYLTSNNLIIRSRHEMSDIHSYYPTESSSPTTPSLDPSLTHNPTPSTPSSPEINNLLP